MADGTTPETNKATLYHALRSSDMADGIQWVERMSKVAAFAVFVWRTTICTNEKIGVKNVLDQI